MTPSILFCGDPHGEFNQIHLAAKRFPDLPIVLLGDMEARRPLSTELAGISNRCWWIHGNHDTDSEQSWINLWFGGLADRSLHGLVVTLPGEIRVAGLGGVFRESVWHPDPGSSTAKKPAFQSRDEHATKTPRQDRCGGSTARRHWSSIYPAELDRLANIRADVLVTHEAPAYHPHGVEVLDTLAQSMGVSLVVHGHHHDALDSSALWSTQGFKSFGVGLRGVSRISLDGELEVISPGELDERRGNG